MKDGLYLEIEQMQEAIGASDEDVASKARMSSKTVARAKKGKVPEGTREAILNALEALRIETHARTAKPFKRSARTAG